MNIVCYRHSIWVLGDRRRWMGMRLLFVRCRHSTHGNGCSWLRKVHWLVQHMVQLEEIKGKMREG